MDKRATDQINGLVSKVQAVAELRKALDEGGVLSCAGVCAGAQSLIGVAVAACGSGRPVVIITEGVKSQEVMHQDVETWLRGLENAGSARPGGEQALYFPAWEILPHEERLPHADVMSERLETLVALSTPTIPTAGGVGPIVVTNAVALMQRTFPPGFVKESTRRLRCGEQMDPLDLVEWLENQGYEPEVQVSQKGEIALRGGILDVYPLTSPWPVRLEFFGNELESIRYFDPVSQVSRETIEEISIPPGGELRLLRGMVERNPKNPGLATLLDHLPEGSLMVVCEPEAVAAQVDQYAEQVPKDDPFFASWPALQQQPKNSRWIAVREGAIASDKDLGFVSLEAFRPVAGRGQDPHVAEAQRRDFFNQLHRWLRQGRQVLVFCNNDGERQRFHEIWQEYGLGETDDPSGPARPVTLLGSLSRGFLHDAAGLVVVTDAEIFGRYRVQRPRRLRSPHAQATRSALDINFADLEEGDYVVHLQHGIGCYLGVHMLPVSHGSKPLDKAEDLPVSGQECLVIQYASRDPSQPAPKLYVPVGEAHLVSKYVGAGKARPPLNTLGGGRWAKTKEHAERAVRDLAGELLTIQAARFSQEGHAFGPDTAWQREFEGSFLYTETPDQMRTIQESKADMEAARPMDRLVCGDVGYGKTEVAIRGAFKAVMAGKQVAVLVPTTVLAQQHYNTFRERMADYPVRIELLSRFRTGREQAQVLVGLGQGSVDIVIGTHRLIQSDIRFKDLGLVVIDEEQRFGVLHKEKFKTLRTLVDVLTLSATPIPRTLYLALTGARDMSTIETPPLDRLPVETIVTEYDERIIRDAIQRELNRGGQVFYLHNRVVDIETVAHRLRDLLPEARIVVGHGQMRADDLEEVMTCFVNGEADVLLSTTIIESGLDIPNANTIIIDHAHRFGLSDLYQLRGRVGRYKHQAYAYLMIPRHARMLTDARKRIAAIKQYSALGSGFKIAMRDLEIRGAGNMLGAQQSGHITAVGFELYCQLLKQSVASLKGEKVCSRLDVPVHLDFLALNVVEEGAAKDVKGPRPTASIPPSYVQDSKPRIELYRKLAQASDHESVAQLRRELRDRFGPVPPPVERLLLVAALRISAQGKGITSIETKDDRLMLKYQGDYFQPEGRFPRLTRKDPKARLKEIARFVDLMPEARNR